MRGSPIRTSSDQRSVGSSPRLIAASYVLHRLLVPRHPPCALNNLATQLQQPPHNPSAPLRSPAPQGRRPAPGRRAARACNQRRCSRPLCSSQRPTGHHPTRPADPTRATRDDDRMSGTRTRTAPDRDNRPHTGPDARAPDPRGSAPSGPNSVPTPDPAPPPRSPPADAGRTSSGQTKTGRTGQRSTLEHHPSHPRTVGDDDPSRAGRGSAPDSAELPGPCSLERR